VVDLVTPRGDSLHADLRAAAERAPTTRDDTSGAIVVLRHDDVEALAHDRRLAGVALAMFDLMGITGGPLRAWYGGLMFTNDGSAHDRLRSLVSRAFTPRSVDALRTDAAAMAASAMAPVVADGGGDLVDVFARLAMRVMCRHLGVPDADVDEFAGWADALSPTFGFMRPDQITAATDAITALLAYVDDLATRRRKDPGPDLITALLAAEDGGDRLTHEELVAMVANLLVGGHDTTTSQIGCSLVTLLRYSEQSARLADDPDMLTSAATETIRFEPSLPLVPRTTVEALSIGEIEAPADSLVFLCTAAANREASVWDHADSFDVARFTRPQVPRLLSFGAGPHYCLGAALARLTVEEVVRSVVVEPPSPFTLTEDPTDIPWRAVLGRSPARLTVAAEPAPDDATHASTR
jgi:cytochrome P450